MSTKLTPADTRTTLAAIDATLRLTDKPLWEDPEFCAWEHGQTQCAASYELDHDTPDHVQCILHEPGPEHWVNHVWGRPAETVHINPMVDLVNDHRPRRMCCDLAESDLNWSGAMQVTADDYPPPGQATHGPVLLGPEPA